MSYDYNIKKRVKGNLIIGAIIMVIASLVYLVTHFNEVIQFISNILLAHQ